MDKLKLEYFKNNDLDAVNRFMSHNNLSKFDILNITENEGYIKLWYWQE